ncbi:hypothetical protein HK097_008527 [Rhizophlyctis rosea]|uniref:Cyclin-like domain-containing protein n=1 Tax=Rhizophlyctis rosea TaxID=64517 RepID=A0AAD5SBS1_9FUNG|nr:hypothetical protein HK097_008527 [Rhizophlyctis rosea]
MSSQSRKRPRSLSPPPRHSSNRTSHPKTPPQPKPSQTQWNFSPEELTRTPSIQDGLTIEQERNLRLRGAKFITSCGASHRVPQNVISVACIYFQRFYVRQSFKEHQHWEIAAACLFTAAKVEENVLKLGALAFTCAKKAKKDETAVYDDKCDTQRRWRERILWYEGVILSTLCFDLEVEKPEAYIAKFASRLQSLQGDKQLLHIAWGLGMDCFLKTTMCLEFVCTEVACAALLLAARFLNTPAIVEEMWKTAENVNRNRVYEAAKRMLAFLQTTSTAALAKK